MFRKFAFAVLGFLLVVGVIELGSFVCLSFFERPQMSFEANYRSLLESGSPAKDRWFGTRISHPYFGFVRELSEDKVNNMGFVDPHRFPYERKPGEFVVGLFGGSVAMVLGANEEAKEIIADAIRNKFPELRDRRVVVLNMAIGGSKQPQAYFVFSYFQKDIDMAINLEGFNEISVTGGAGYPAEFPLDSRYYAHADTKELRVFGQVELARSGLREIARLPLEVPLLRYSQTYYLMTREIFEILSHWAARKTERFRETPGAAPGLSTEETIALRVGIWRRYALMQASLANSVGVSNLFFIQPNQYVSGSKTLSTEELKSAYGGPTPLFDKGLRAIESEIPSLQSRGVLIWSLLDVFKTQTQSLYIDPCCHLSQEGNRLLARAMGQAIAESRLRLLTRRR